MSLALHVVLTLKGQFWGWCVKEEVYHLDRAQTRLSRQHCPQQSLSSSVRLLIPRVNCWLSLPWDSSTPVLQGTPRGVSEASFCSGSSSLVCHPVNTIIFAALSSGLYCDGLAGPSCPARTACSFLLSG